MSDRKCKSNVVSPSVVLNTTVEQVSIGGRQLQRWVGCNYFGISNFLSVFDPTKTCVMFLTWTVLNIRVDVAGAS